MAWSCASQSRAVPRAWYQWLLSASGDREPAYLATVLLFSPVQHGQLPLCPGTRAGSQERGGNECSSPLHPLPSKPLFLSKEGLPRAFQNTWGHCDLEKGTEGAQVYGLLGKELGQEPSSSPLCGLWDDMDSQHGTCLSGIREML